MLIFIKTSLDEHCRCLRYRWKSGMLTARCSSSTHFCCLNTCAQPQSISEPHRQAVHTGNTKLPICISVQCMVESSACVMMDLVAFFRTPFHWKNAPLHTLVKMDFSEKHRWRWTSVKSIHTFDALVFNLLQRWWYIQLGISSWGFRVTLLPLAFINNLFLLS